MRPLPTAALAALVLASGPAQAAADRLPPDDRLVSAGCRWEQAEGGGLSLSVQACDLVTGRWRVAWNAQRRGFELSVNGQAHSLVVQPWPVEGSHAQAGLAGVVAALKAAGHLPPDSACRLQPAALRPLPRTAATYVLAPPVPVPAVTASGEVPEPPCGAYGASTHGVRYFLSDLRWPGLVVFVDEGQDQPMFDPASIAVRRQP